DAVRTTRVAPENRNGRVTSARRAVTRPEGPDRWGESIGCGEKGSVVVVTVVIVIVVVVVIVVVIVVVVVRDLLADFVHVELADLAQQVVERRLRECPCLA